MPSAAETAPAHAVAVDLGATSVRFAYGTLSDGNIRFEVVDQMPHEPKSGRWDVDLLADFCRRTCEYAASVGPGCTVGIDSWGVDHGFVNPDGELIQAPVCYRDPTHQAVFDEMAEHRPRLYELTGIAHQPFNTIWQLVARARENPGLKGAQWLILPELFAHLLGCPAGHELTQASTTQLMGTDGKWSKEALAIAGWPVPGKEPKAPGSIAGRAWNGVEIVRVGGHDTASAVCGLGALEEDEAFLNVGTWSLLGCLLEKPLTSAGAEKANFSNEWTVDGRIRFLKNIPGFYVINRLHEELGVAVSVPEWIAHADQRQTARFDLMSPDFFNPASMVQAVSKQLASEPNSLAAWAGVALGSLVEGTVRQLENLKGITGREFRAIRIAGGGSNSPAFCEALARASKRTVLAGPGEATVLGNLGAQFLAQGRIGSWQELGGLLRSSISLRRFEPEI